MHLFFYTVHACVLLHPSISNPLLPLDAFSRILPYNIQHVVRTYSQPSGAVPGSSSQVDSRTPRRDKATAG